MFFRRDNHRLEKGEAEEKMLEEYTENTLIEEQGWVCWDG